MKRFISKFFEILLFALFILLLIFFSCKGKNTTSPMDEDIVKPFNNVPLTEDIVMYEVNFRAFSTTGDFNGVAQKLDHIKSLGINVIWLMPIYPIGKLKSVNSPYCVQDYMNVNPEFGTITDFKKLISESHKKDMAVILDWVANHTAWDNSWISNRSWYTQDSQGEIISPPGTNWSDVAELNYDNDTMRIAMIDAMKYWITEMNVDGFRCDAADYVPTDFWQQAIDTLENIQGRKLIFVAEGSKTEHFVAGFQMNYAWDFFAALKNVYINRYSAGTIFTINSNEYANIPTGKHKLRYTTNHDESAWNATPVALFGGIKSSFSAFVIATSLGGVPLVYGSQEVGVQNNVSFFTKNPIDWTQNPDLLMEYQKLLTVYSQSKVLRTGTLETFSSNDVVAFKKVSETNEAFIMVNVRSKAVSFTVPTNLQNTSWTNILEGNEYTLGTMVDLGAFDYIILKR